MERIIPEKTVNTKFWGINQNNSGGYFVENEENGICSYIIIEAETADEAENKLRELGEKVDGFWNYCSCCGERWYVDFDEDEGKEEPCYYEDPVTSVVESFFTTYVYVHYYDGTFKKIDLVTK